MVYAALRVSESAVKRQCYSTSLNDQLDPIKHLMSPYPYSTKRAGVFFKLRKNSFIMNVPMPKRGKTVDR